MEFLMGNPFSTPVGQRVESATGSSLPSEDWALNMEICDMINSSEDGAKDAVRALKKRIMGNRNFKEVMLALTVLETCVKNCGYKFHILVTTRDFVEGVLVRSIIPKNNPPLILHDRVLSIVQAWADAFRSSPDLTGVVSVYEDLRRKGLEFPVTELDGYAPIQAPQKPSPGNGPSVATLPSALLPSKPPLIPPLTSQLKLALEGNNAFTSVQVKQLKTELGVVRSNLTMMSDMMTQLDPVTVKEADMELLEQLYTVCKEMQDRIVKVVPRLSEEKLIEELLAANDEINSAFTRYHRFERRIPNSQSAAEKSQTYVNLTDFDLTPESVSQSGVPSVTNSSFSLSKADSFSSQMARLSTSESDDALSQNINISTRQRPSELSEVAEDGPAEAQDSRLRSAVADGSPASTRSASPKLDWMIKRGMIPINQSTVMDDIEKWLELDNEYDDLEDADGVTSEEFDKFLAGRAQAAERLPSLRASSQDANHSQSSATPGT
ncbi:target of Myb protein 1 isoform X2 [Pungitius pungitius]|uniref:target of Myb protein 1 isoform X2 n=1 Tax=Pungitius pungitius TaxID=134920 RepID=UPI001886E113|nr:target of Myb protein 1 isoform X2 [Pungitius pungitius]